MQYSIELKNVCKTYPGFALKNVSFQLPKGSIMGFIGMNGAGKSTTMKSILNMVRPQSGEITVLGLDPAKNEEEIKQNIGVVFDESHLWATCIPTGTGNSFLDIYAGFPYRKTKP